VFGDNSARAGCGERSQHPGLDLIMTSPERTGFGSPKFGDKPDASRPGPERIEGVTNHTDGIARFDSELA
jgi:hypothetical protein